MATFAYNRGMQEVASGKRPGRLRSSAALPSFDVKEQPEHFRGGEHDGSPCEDFSSYADISLVRDYLYFK
jgi:hypothetical protein